MFETSAAETELGRSGIVVAVIADEGADASEFPYAFVAVTVNVYAVLDCRPSTTTGEDTPVAVYPPGDDTTVYPVINPPDVGAEKDTDAAPLLNARDVPTSVAETFVGEPGIAPNVTHPEEV